MNPLFLIQFQTRKYGVCQFQTRLKECCEGLARMLVKTNLVKRNVLTGDAYNIASFHPNMVSMFSLFIDVVQNVTDDEKSLDIFAMLVWTLWHRRNQLGAANKDYPISKVIPHWLSAFDVFVRAVPIKPTTTVVHKSYSGKMATSSFFKVQS